MEELTSRVVDTYQEGEWTVKVRRNAENDRIDEGDVLEQSTYQSQLNGQLLEGAD